MKPSQDRLDLLSIYGMISAILIVLVGFLLYFSYSFWGGDIQGGTRAVFLIGFGNLMLVLGQLGWYGRRVKRLEREVETLRGKERPD